MSAKTPLAADPTPPAVSSGRARWDLLLISLLLLFLELACIRWFPAHVLFLTFFTNTVLLACFLGMSVGCLVANQRRNYLTFTPVLLVLAMFAAHGVEQLMGVGSEAAVDVGNQASPQVVYFGTEANHQDIARFVIPLEVLGGFFFLVLALAMVGPGQVLGRALGHVTNRIQAYTINIIGSLIGIALFSLCSWAQLPPVWWFLPVVLGLGYFLYERPITLDVGFRFGLLALILVAVTINTGPDQDSEGTVREHLWSPYYRMDYAHAPQRRICVNLIGHQQMVSSHDNSSPAYAYALPHLLHRDAQATTGTPPQAFEEVLVIGAGSGNDVSRALQWGARHVDAVEIDPVIQELGRKEHPDQPYQDPRVTVHLDDGRNFLRSTDKKYDLIVYALVDSLVLHSSYSNIRLESYLFTQQALEDVRKRLKPGGVFVMYNYFRQGWIVARLHKGLEEVFGEAPLVLTLPYQQTVEPEQGSGGFTLFLCGEGTHAIRQAFASQGDYWVSGKQAPSLATANGFAYPPAAERSRWQGLTAEQKQHEPFVQFGLAQVIQPAEPLRMATDDWPFLYMRQPMIPDLSLRGAATMGGLALLLLLAFAPRGQTGGRRWPLDGRMFFLGAGFMLIETKAVVHMALLFGSTWMVNSVVFFALLVMVLAANLFVLTVRPQRLWPYYAGLLASLALNCVVPLDFFLGMERGVQVAGSCLLVFAPILFAGVIFAVSFAHTEDPGRAFGANIAGAMLGGLAEYASMLLGFQYLVVVAIGFYVLSMVALKRLWPAAAAAPQEEHVHELVAN
jgi:SAM-dependent methyltransferase